MARQKRYRWRGFGDLSQTAQLPPAPKARQQSGPFTPATGKQVSYLRDLRRRYGIPLTGRPAEALKPLSKLSKAEASAEIERLRPRE